MRDHRDVGKEMDLFHFEEEAPGTVFWHKNGWKLFQQVLSYLRTKTQEYDEVNTPMILNKSLWEKSGHWDLYKPNIFAVKSARSFEDPLNEDKRIFALKPMNCPGHIQIFNHKLRSYRELPFRVSEFGTVHRYEPSGSLHGLMRVRGFTQDDGHIFCTQAQIESECLTIHHSIMQIYKDFGFSDITVKLSTRPENRIGSDELWDQSEVSTEIVPGDGAFYGPKLEYTLRDSTNREWQCGTVQLDFNLPSRLDISYINEDGLSVRPVLIHRAMLGSIERWIGILLENGDLPLWLQPIQVMVCPISEKYISYAKKIQQLGQSQNIKIQCDTNDETISNKIRKNFSSRIPILFIVGEGEEKNQTVSIKSLIPISKNLLNLQDAFDK